MIGIWTPLFRVTCGVPAEVAVIKLSLLVLTCLTSSIDFS
jgi:hypothetical protein